MKDGHLYIWLSLQLGFNDGVVQSVKPKRHVYEKLCRDCNGTTGCPNPMSPEKVVSKSLELGHDRHLQNVPPVGLSQLTNADKCDDFSHRHSTSQFP